MPRDRLLILRRATRLEAASPEHRYLATLVVARARRVFREVTAVEAVAGDDLAATWVGPLAEHAEDAPVLVMSGGNLYLGDGSLAAMAATLDDVGADGAEVVAPGALERFASVATLPEIHTLRGFEEVEATLLAGGDEAPAGGAVPVALYRAARLRREVERRGWEGVLADQWLGASESGVARCGIYHAFADYWGQAREDILPFVPADAKDVLEVGCARGLTGALLQQRTGCRVTGVELNPEAAAEARSRLHRVLEGDIEEIDLHGPYDAVVATELFEHLRYPERLLDRLRPELRPGGRIVLSIPNVGHHSIVRDLLAGRWDYLPIGLLCYTHFRFFTRATLEDWLRGAGFTRFEIVAQQTADEPRLDGLTVELDRESLRTKGFYVMIWG